MLRSFEYRRRIIFAEIRYRLWPFRCTRQQAQSHRTQRRNGANAISVASNWAAVSNCVGLIAGAADMRVARLQIQPVASASKLDIKLCRIKCEDSRQKCRYRQIGAHKLPSRHRRCRQMVFDEIRTGEHRARVLHATTQSNYIQTRAHTQRRAHSLYFTRW